MLQLFLFLHVFGAIAVFGPTFVFPLIASRVRKSPQNGHFASELAETIESKIVIPIAIVLYVIAIGYAIVVQRPAAMRMVQLTGAMSGPPPAGAPAGPPPEIVATGKKLQQGGMLLTVLLVLIVLLMVVKPTIA